MENTATPRQRWALYCITKKDYRNEIISKEEAARLIKELGDPEYKKKEKKNLTLEEELLQYLKDNIDVMYQAFLNEIQYKSVLEDDTHIAEDKRKRYAFVGCGCGITYLKYRANKFNAHRIDEAACRYRNNEILDLLVKKFPKKDYKYLEKIGCPMEAVWTQMQNLQRKYFYFVQQFAKSKGIEIDVISHID